MLATGKQGLTSKSSKEKSAYELPALIAAVVLLVLFVGFMAHQTLFPPTPSLSKQWGMDKSNFPGWVNDVAMQCQGNMYQLSPDMQTKIRAQYKDGGVNEVRASYALQTH